MTKADWMAIGVFVLIVVLWAYQESQGMLTW